MGLFLVYFLRGRFLLGVGNVCVTSFHALLCVDDDGSTALLPLLCLRPLFDPLSFPIRRFSLRFDRGQNGLSLIDAYVKSLFSWCYGWVGELESFFVVSPFWLPGYTRRAPSNINTSPWQRADFGVAVY